MVAGAGVADGGCGGSRGKSGVVAKELSVEIVACAAGGKRIQQRHRGGLILAAREGLAMAGAVQAMLREVLDIRQAAEYLGISDDTLYRYASEGFIPAFKLGNRWRFKRSLLDSWMVEMSGKRGASSSVAVMPKEKKPAARAR